MPELGPQQFGVQEGQMLAGKYRVERVLGVGGMGVVVAAHHVQLDERVAIKLLLPERGESPISTRRFVREARAAVKIKSEHVARVFDVGTLEDGAPYIVMEFLEGSDLAVWLAESGPLPIEQAVEFVLQACVAVAEAHRLGIVHRDLKPSNLFCTKRPDGQILVKVLDFGISKMRDVGDSVSGTATAEGTMLGSPLYMSPEQLNSSKDVESATDIWALGVVLYQLLCGSVPFAGHTLAAVASKIATEPPAPLRPLRADVPAGLEVVIARCLQKAPADRYGSVAELAAALLNFAPRRARVYLDRIAGATPSESPLARTPAPPPGAPMSGPARSDAPISTTGPISGAIGSTGQARTSVRKIVARLAIALALLGAGATAAAALLHAPPRELRPLEGPESLSSKPAPPSETSPPAAPTQPATAAAPLASATAPEMTLQPPKRLPSHGIPKAKPGVSPEKTPGTAQRAPNPPASGAPSGCKVVSFFDSDGNQHFKQDCEAK
jgi:eukaryotic-like serine/threonine-protein kinase